MPQMTRQRKWIAAAVAKHPGKFSRGCPGGHATQACIRAGQHSRNPTRRREANLAATLRSFHRK